MLPDANPGTGADAAESRETATLSPLERLRNLYPESGEKPKAEEEKITPETEEEPEAEADGEAEIQLEEEIESEPEAEAEEESDSETEEEVEEPDTKKLYTIKIDGVEEKVSFTELRELAQQGKDYTNKLKKFSEEKKLLERKPIEELQKQSQEYLNKLEMFGKIIHSQAITKEVLEKTLAEEGTEAYLKLKAQEEERIAKLSGIAQEWNQTKQSMQQQALAMVREEAATHTKILAEKMPHLMTKEGGERLVKYLRDCGYDTKEIASAYDSRALSIAEKARRWDELQSKRPNVNKKTAKAPKVLKPGKVKEASDIKMDQKRKALANQRKNRGDKVSTVEALRAIYNQ